MSYKMVFGNDVLCIPAASLQAINRADKLELRLLLLLAGNKKYLTSFTDNRKQISSQLGCTVSDVDRALAFWIGVGIICKYDNSDNNTASAQPINTTPTDKKPYILTDMPKYSSTEISNILSQNNGQIKQLIDECQQLSGKIFNPTEVGKLVSLVDYLRLDAEYIMILFEYCCARDKKSVAYVEKTAYNLYNDGIQTADQLNAYLFDREQRETMTAKLRQLFGIGARALTHKENQMVCNWVTEWNQSYELIQCAYEKTVNSTKEFSFNYINKILENWHKNGITTVKEANEESQKRKTNQNNQGSSFNMDDFFEKALQRSYQSLEDDNNK